MHNDTDTVARPPEHAPINWVTTILFTALPLAAVTVVPWYGFTHGFSLAAWVLALVFLWACGIAITAGYHRLWAHRAYSAHWSGANLPDAVRRHGAAEQHPGLGLAAPHPSPVRRRLGQGSVQREARFLVFAHGLDPARLPERQERFLERARPRARSHRQFSAPVLHSAHGLHEPRRAAARGLGRGRRVGRVPARGHPASRDQPPLHVVHQLAGPHVGLAAVHGREHGARQPGAGVPDVRRGLSQLPPHLPERLPQRREVVAVRPDQVADRGPVVRRISPAT